MNDSCEKELTTKEKIFRNAIKLFAKNGYHGASIRELATMSGIKESSIYNHYKSKADILSDIYRFFLLKSTERKPDVEYLMFLLTEGGVEHTLRCLIDGYITHYASDEMKDAWSVLSQEQYRDEKAMEIILKVTEHYLGMTNRLFKTLYELGYIRRKENLDVLANMYAYAMRAMHLEYALLCDHKRDADYMRQKIYDVLHLIAEIAGA